MKNNARRLLDVLVKGDVDRLQGVLGQFPPAPPQEQPQTKDREEERAGDHGAEDGRARAVDRIVAAFLRRLVLGRRRRGLRRGQGRGGDGCEGVRRARRRRFLLKRIIKICWCEGRHVSGERLGRT